jgi:hypothetical protein
LAVVRAASPVSRLVLVTPLLAGCHGPELAPVELDELVHFFLAQAGLQEHEAIGQGADNLTALFDASELVEDGEAGGMDQSHHIQVCSPRDDDTLLHLYAVLNHGWFGSIGEHRDFWSKLYLGGLEDYDARLQELCDGEG